MLPGSPGHELWRRDFTGGCGLFSLTLRAADPAARARFIDALALLRIGYSWGGFESLVIPFGPDLPRSATAWPAEPGEAGPRDPSGRGLLSERSRRRGKAGGVVGADQPASTECPDSITTSLLSTFTWSAG